MTKKDLISDGKLQEIVLYYLNHGIKETATNFNLAPATLERYIRCAKQKGFLTKHLQKTTKIIESVGINSIKSLEKGIQPVKNTAKYSFDGKTIKFGAMGDLHLGSIYTEPTDVINALAYMKKEKCQFITIGGDVTEGMSHRAGHIYECSHLGYSRQKAHAVEVLSHFDLKMYMIDGNHDRWFIKSNGALIVPDICESLPNAEFLGHDEGDIIIDGVKIRLWHGEDGSSYAHSYRLQKLVESFTGGDKPDVLLAGHVHKSLSCFDRHVHCISTGAMQKQSKWMRSKRLPSHTGFWIIEMTINKLGVGRLKTEWFPLYN